MSFGHNLPGEKCNRPPTYFAPPSRRQVVFSPLVYHASIVLTVKEGQLTDWLPCEADVPRRVVRSCMRRIGKKSNGIRHNHRGSHLYTQEINVDVCGGERVSVEVKR